MQTITLEIPLRDAGKLAAVALAHGKDLAAYLSKETLDAARNGELQSQSSPAPAPAAPAAQKSSFGSLR